MAGSDDQMGAGFGDLSGLDPTIIDPLIGIRHGPGTTAAAAAVCAVTVRVELAQVLGTAAGDFAAFFKVGLTEGLQ